MATTATDAGASLRAAGGDGSRARTLGTLRTLRAIALATGAALAVLGVLWELILAPTGTGTLALKVLPLACSLPFLWRSSLAGFRWMSLLVWLYVGEGLTRGPSEAGLSSLLAWAEVGLGVALFAACGAWVRTRLRLDRAPPPRREAA